MRTLKLDIQVEVDEEVMRSLKLNPEKVEETLDAILSHVHARALLEITRRLGGMDG